MADKLSMQNFFDEVTAQIITVVDFYTEWCQPCQQMFRILPSLEVKLGDTARIVKVDIDEDPDLKDIYHIKKIPTFVILKNGAEVERLPEGKMPLLRDIENAVNRVRQA